MAASLVGGAAVGAVFGELLKAVLEIRGKAGMFKQTLASLRSTLVAITPTIKEIEQHNNDLGRPKEELEWLIKEMEKGTKLVCKCSKIHRLNYVARTRYQDRLEEFIDSLVRFFTINMQAYTSRDQKETLLELRKIRSLINKSPLVNPEDTAGSSSDSITVSESDIYDSKTTQPADENAVETNCTEEAMENINQLTRNSSWDSDSVYFSACEDESDIPHSPTQSAENAVGTNSAEQTLVPLTSIAHETYDRSCIEKWMQSGYLTCLKTQQTLTSTVIVPNYVLRSLVEQWCEANGIETPIRASSSQPCKSASTYYSPAERSKIGNLLQKLKSVSPEDKRLAAGEIRLLTNRITDNRVAIAEAGAIPLLVSLLSVLDSRTQEHAVTALLNLSLYENNKGILVLSGAIPSIVHVLKKGSMEARENAAATLFSLSIIDENKFIIGSSGAIPALLTLLSEGTQRGKKVAAIALFDLCTYKDIRGMAVSAGVITTLMRLLTEPSWGMVDEALIILAILSRHPERKIVIGAEKEAVPVLVEFICNGSQKNKEDAAGVLVNLCSGGQQYLAQAQELGVMGPLFELAQNGTGRGKRKAAHLIELMDMFL